MDLYATPNQTFWRVTFPLVLPGIAAAAMLSFSLSFDDFIITNLNAGNTTTFPMYVWGVSRKTIPMQINVVGTVMLLISVLIVVGGEVNARRRRRAFKSETPARRRGGGAEDRGRVARDRRAAFLSEDVTTTAHRWLRRSLCDRHETRRDAWDPRHHA